MASLEQQLKKAKADLEAAKDLQNVFSERTKPTRYGKFDPKSESGKQVLADLDAASKKVNQAQKYYDNLLAAYNKELEKKTITGAEEGVSEEVQAAKQGITVEQLRANKQKALDEAESKKSQEQSAVTDQAALNNYTQFRDLIADPANSQMLIDVQKDLKKNFPAYYKGNTTGLADWVETQKALEAIYTARGSLPTNLRGTDLRTFLANPTIPGFGSNVGGTGGVTTSLQVSDPTRAASLIKSVFNKVLNREATAEELAKFTKELNVAERKNPFKTVNGVTTGGIDKEEFLTQAIQKLPEYATKKAEKLDTTKQSVLKLMRANGLPVNEDQVNNFATAVQNGTSIDTVAKQIRQIAGAGLPDNIKNLLAQGIDLDTVYSPYKSTMASTLELNPNDIQLNDPTLRMALGPEKEMSIFDFQRMLKKDNRWQYTNNAKEEISQSVQKVLQDFGFKG